MKELCSHRIQDPSDRMMITGLRNRVLQNHVLVHKPCLWNEPIPLIIRHGFRTDACYPDPSHAARHLSLQLPKTHISNKSKKFHIRNVPSSSPHTLSMSLQIITVSTGQPTTPIPKSCRLTSPTLS